MKKNNKYIPQKPLKDSLDEKDKKIISSLIRDASLSFAEIEKETKIPRYVVANRIKKLEKKEIIKAYKLSVNYKILGLEEFEIHLRLMGIDEQKMVEIIKNIEKNPHVSWIGRCFGNYDLKINVFAKSNSELYTIVNDALKEYREFIKAQEISSITKKHKTDKTSFLRTILESNTLSVSEEKGKKESEKIRSSDSTPKLDSVDLGIIKHLGKNPRIKLTELSKKTNLTVQGVKNRINSLYSRKIILGSSALLNGQKLGYIWATCLFKITLTEEQEKPLEQHIYSLPNASSAVRLLGKWDLGITFFDTSVKALQERINEFKGMYKDNIKDYDSFIILDIYKYPELPECIFSK
jgi:DNA-binding Lrp family transcriptional regulator